MVTLSALVKDDSDMWGKRHTNDKTKNKTKTEKGNTEYVTYVQRRRQILPEQKLNTERKERRTIRDITRREGTYNDIMNSVTTAEGGKLRGNEERGEE